MAITLTYSGAVKGWPSFYSYVPDMMIGMNNFLYSFKNGNLWKHNTNEVRNNFYGAQYNSRIEGVINDSPSDVKTFKTISLESTAPWEVNLSTDLQSGYIDPTWFVEKEGDYFAHIRRNDDDGNFNARSAQGIGIPSSVDTSDSAAISISFSKPLGSIISVGDKVYTLSNQTPSLVGVVISLSGSVMIVNGTDGTSLPSTSEFILYIKNNQAESYGAKGYYMGYVLENDSTSFVELFAIGSSFFKSFP
jgi:hypothetical protein